LVFGFLCACLFYYFVFTLLPILDIVVELISPSQKLYFVEIPIKEKVILNNPTKHKKYLSQIST
jgi:hypothetical protein